MRRAGNSCKVRSKRRRCLRLTCALCHEIKGTTWSPMPPPQVLDSKVGPSLEECGLAVPLCQRPRCRTPSTNLIKWIQHPRAIVPFDPLRQVAHRLGKATAGDDEPMALVTEAVERRGCVGVKLYPPMGFAALGNALVQKEQGPHFWRRDWLPAWTDRADMGQLLDEAMPGCWVVRRARGADHGAYRRLERAGR
jgi:hypothetical protein